MREIIIGLARTVTPAIAGWVIALPFIAPLGITTAQAEGVLAAVFAGLYWLAVRAIAVYVPQAQWLLGAPTAPVYPQDTDADPIDLP